MTSGRWRATQSAAPSPLSPLRQPNDWLPHLSVLVTAIALFFSTFTSSTLSAIFTLSLYVIGHLTADLRAMVATNEGGMGKAVVEVLYYLCPNLEMLNIKGQAAVGIPAAPEYMMLASLYGLLYAGMLLTVACLVFQRRDF